jgi:hypothetical protein
MLFPNLENRFENCRRKSYQIESRTKSLFIRRFATLSKIVEDKRSTIDDFKNKSVFQQYINLSNSSFVCPFS